MLIINVRESGGKDYSGKKDLEPNATNISN